MSQGRTEMGQVGFQDDAPVDEVDEQLVAYLDGELSPEDLRSLEKQLGSDAALRARLRELQNGWEMLDELPLAASSGTLLETTIRMAAVDGNAANPAQSKLKSHKLYRFSYLLAATISFFLLGFVGMRVVEAVQYRSQLRDLPIAMHLDAYIHASDLDLMRNLAVMPQWKEANEIADTLGEWNFELADQIDATSANNREALLVTLSSEDQKSVSAKWERFEKIAPEDRQAVYDVAALVASQDDPKTLLKTMDRFAEWRESLPASDRDLFTRATDAERQEFVKTALKRTTQNWTRERGKELSDEDVETIYGGLRQIARSRMDAIRQNGSPAVRVAIATFELNNQSMDPRFQAYFLRRLFEPPVEIPPRRPDESADTRQPPPGPPPPRPPSFPSAIGQNAFANVRIIIEEISGPLLGDELYKLELILPEDLTNTLDDASAIPPLREALLRSWADESIRRMQSTRDKQTIVEKYQDAAPNDREQIDLLPADRMLRSLQGDAEGRR